MFVIGEAIIEDEIAREEFSCDLHQCKGACCTLPGGRGAPLQDEEVTAVQEALPFALKYLTPERTALAHTLGVVEGAPGNYATVCIENRDCIFVFYEDGIARCSLERAYADGATKFRKPISCHLFPIRVGSNRLRYESIRECHPARVQGKRLHVPLYRFLKDALVRKYGAPWYEEFAEMCARDTKNE